MSSIFSDGTAFDRLAHMAILAELGNPMTDLQVAHDRAVRAVLNAMHLASEEEATEVVDSMAALVLETIKAFLPQGEGEETCN